MRQTISGMIAAIAVVAAGTVPASACGCSIPAADRWSSLRFIRAATPVAAAAAGAMSGCPIRKQQYGYYAAPVHQYYYADQGPTYTGPGDFAPYPTYQENAVGGWGAYRHHPYHYGYDGGRYADATSHYYDGAPNVKAPRSTPTARIRASVPGTCTAIITATAWHRTTASITACVMAITGAVPLRLWRAHDASPLLIAAIRFEISAPVRSDLRAGVLYP